MFSRWYGWGTLDSHRLGITQAGKVTFWLKTSADVFIGLESTSTSYNDNIWYHVAGTYSSSSGRATLYINGRQVSYVIYSPSGSWPNEEAYQASKRLSTNNATQLVIGSDDTNDRYFHGAISDVRIWNVTRTESQIASSYQYRLNGNEPGLEGYWKLDQASATGYPNNVTGFRDATSNANNSTSIQFAAPLTWNTTIGFVPTPT